MVAFGYEMLADKDITEGENGDNRHAVLLLLAEFHSKHSEWDKLVTCCEQAVELNPLHEQSISMLAGAYKRLGKVAEEEARRQGFLVLQLEVRETQERAIQLYEKHDYQRWGTLPHYEIVNGRRYAGHFYFKSIGMLPPREQE